MNYLLDTCVVSDFVKGEPHTLNRIKNTSPSAIAVSTITLMEIHYGLALNAQRTASIKPLITDFITAVTVVGFGEGDAEKAAQIRAVLKQQGRPIGSYDVLLAGTALHRDLVLVSANVNEFNRIENLKLENWRRPATS